MAHLFPKLLVIHIRISHTANVWNTLPLLRSTEDVYGFRRFLGDNDFSQILY